VDGADVLTEDAEEDELNGGSEEDADEKRCEAEGEGLPEGEFEKKIHAGDEEGDGGTDKAGEGGEAQGDAGVVDDAENPDVIEGVPVVFGDSMFALGLIVEDALDREADVGDHAAEVRVGVVEGADEVHDLAVVEAEAGEVLDGLDAGETLGELVVLAANKEE
jgi:hypothetical protein